MTAWVSANPILAVLAAVIILICIICGLARLLLRGEDGPRDEAAEFDAYLDETSILELTHDEHYPRATNATDAGGTAGLADERRDGSGRTEPTVQHDGDPDPDDRTTPDGQRAKLTSAQRRRAVHKGRIPRDLPAPPGRMPAPRGGESTERLISGLLAAELKTGHMIAAQQERAREAETHRERAELEARIDEAYRVVGAGFADLEARNWLELAA